MNKNEQSPITVEEWIESTREFVKPIDFDSLIEAGILGKKGSWYKVLKYRELPSHIKAKIIKFKQTTKNNQMVEFLVKFSKPSKSLEKILKNFEAKDK